MWYSKKYVKMLGNVMKPLRWIWIMNSSVTVSRKGILLCYAESLFVTLNVLPGADYRLNVDYYGIWMVRLRES